MGPIGAAFREQVANAVAECPYLILDVANVGFVDSGGLGTIILCRNRMTQGKTALAICHATSYVRQALEKVQFDKIVRFHNDMQEALAEASAA